MASEEVTLTLPGDETAVTAYGKLRGMTKAILFTHGGETDQAGYVTNFRVELAGGSQVLAATIYGDATFDLESGATLTFSEASIGTLTIAGRTQTLLLPLFF